MDVFVADVAPQRCIRDTHGQDVHFLGFDVGCLHLYRGHGHTLVPVDRLENTRADKEEKRRIGVAFKA